MSDRDVMPVHERGTFSLSLRDMVAIGLKNALIALIPVRICRHRIVGVFQRILVGWLTRGGCLDYASRRAGMRSCGSSKTSDSCGGGLGTCRRAGGNRSLGSRGQVRSRGRDLRWRTGGRGLCGRFRCGSSMPTREEEGGD